MLEFTVLEALDDENNNISQQCRDYDLYSISDGNVTLYVGKSEDVHGRLIEHFNGGLRSQQDIHRLLRSKHVYALRFRVYQSADFLDYDVLAGRLDLLSDEDWARNMTRLKKKRIVGDRDYWESKLISILNPCFNVIYNQNPTPTPEKYKSNEDMSTVFKMIDKISVPGLF